MCASVHTGPTCLCRGHSEGWCKPASRDTMSLDFSVAIMPFTFGGAETMGAPHYRVPGLPRAQLAPGTQKASVRGVGAGGGGGFLSRRPNSRGRWAPCRESNSGLRDPLCCHQCPAGGVSAQGPRPCGCGCNTLRPHQAAPRAHLQMRFILGLLVSRTHISDQICSQVSSEARPEAEALALGSWVGWDQMTSGAAQAGVLPLGPATSG